MADWYEKSTFGDLPTRAAARWGPREALCIPDGPEPGGRWSFQELKDDVDRAARALIALGVQPGERVGVWLGNRHEAVCLMFALARIGAVQIPINTRLQSSEIGYIITQSGCGTLITGRREPGDLLAVLEGWAPELAGGRADAPAPSQAPHLARVVSMQDAGHPAVHDWRAALAAGEDIPPRTLEDRAAAVNPDDPLFIMYTSGTTGFPKGVVHTHNILRNVDDRASRMAITRQDVILMFLPLFHIFGFGDGPTSSLVTGARLVLTQTFDGPACLELVAREKVTVTYGFDTHFQDLLAAQEAAPVDVSSLRTAFVVAGMHSSTDTARRANAVLCPSITGYGMTEVYVGAALSFPTSTLEQRTETSGYPMPGYAIRVVHPETGEDTPPGVPGEILVRGYGVMEGYYEKPEETAGTIDAEGWVHSGDMGLLREDGYLRFIGRYKDMLKVGGENVDPMEIESFLAGHPDIAQAAVVGLPHSRLGEVPVAFIQLSGRADRSAPPDSAAVRAYCEGRLASFKVPRQVVVLDEFPMTSSGKVRKVELRERLDTHFRPGRV